MKYLFLATGSTGSVCFVRLNFAMQLKFEMYPGPLDFQIGTIDKTIEIYILVWVCMWARHSKSISNVDSRLEWTSFIEYTS